MSDAAARLEAAQQATDAILEAHGQAREALGFSAAADFPDPAALVSAAAINLALT